MYHNFLIYSSANGHLDCLHVLAIVNSAEMNIQNSADPLELKTHRNAFESVLMRWVKLEPITQSEASQKEKHQYIY